MSSEGNPGVSFCDLSIKNNLAQFRLRLVYLESRKKRSNSKSSFRIVILSRGLDSAVIKKLSRTPSAGAVAGAADDEAVAVEFAALCRVFSFSSKEEVNGPVDVAPEDV